MFTTIVLIWILYKLSAPVWVWILFLVAVLEELN